MSWSLGEVQALGIKAARGAGLSWGLAEEAGFAVRWLQGHSLPGAAALAGYLTWLGEQREDSTAVCPLSTGTTICDSAAQRSRELPFEVRRLAFPLLALPFAAEAMGKHDPLLVQWDDAVFQIDGRRLARSGDESGLLQQLSTCCLSRETAASVMLCPAATRVPQSASQTIHRLEKFAARTYAPASERSRLTGAGAGTDDQD
ncbi:MAG: DUF3726 domain-containing protein [Rhodovibrionaceae bacterium]